MKVSIDLDGTLHHYQTFFREFTIAMQDRGHQVGILTAHKMIHEAADKALLRELGFPDMDFYIGRPVDMPHSEEGYAPWKASVVLSKGIDLHFEDGCALEMRHILGKEAHRVWPVWPRGRENEHFE